MLAHISAYFVRQFIYGILSDKENIGMKPAYNSNILKKMRTKHSYYGQNAFRNAFMDEFDEYSKVVILLK